MECGSVTVLRGGPLSHCRGTSEKRDGLCQMFLWFCRCLVTLKIFEKVLILKQLKRQ